MKIIELLLSNPLEAIIFIFGILIAISVHEYTHAATAVYFGDDTPRLMGRTTINPLAHIDPWGALFFLIAGFGWGKPVIINPMRFSKRIDELFCALAGPVSNLVFALVLNIIIKLLAASSIGLPQTLLAAFSILAMVNVALAAFNIIPIPPLDGSSIVEYFYPGYKTFGAIYGTMLLLFLLLFPGTNGSLLNSILTPIFNLFTRITLGG